MTEHVGVGDRPIVAAACQFFSGTDVSANLVLCVDNIERAAAVGAELIVLPENANRVRDYPSREACFEKAETIDGPFVTGIRATAARLGVHVVVNADMRGENAPDVFITSLLIGPDGAIIGTHRKHVLWDYEYTLFAAGDEPYAVHDTALGRIGMIICADGIVPETPRVIALLGAQVICNSLNSRGPDEMRVHEPLRAMENGCWMVAANTVGGPPDGWPWTGGSQVIAPDGTVLAQAGEVDPEIVRATIVPSLADTKPERVCLRRPELYRLLRRPIDAVPAAPMYGPVADDEPDDDVRVGLLQVSWYHNDEWTLGRAEVQIAYAARRGCQLAVLPELFAFERRAVPADPDATADRSSLVLDRLCRAIAAAGAMHLVTTIVERLGGRLHHTAVLIGPDGVELGRYRLAHVGAAQGWATPGNEPNPVIATPIGRVGLMIGNEVWIPEVARCLALEGAEFIVHPCDWDVWQARDLAAVERTEENRVHLISCARTDNPAKVGSQIVQADRFEMGQPIALMRYPTAFTTRTGFEEQLVVPLNRMDAHSKMMGRWLDPLATRAPDLYGPIA